MFCCPRCNIPRAGLVIKIDKLCWIDGNEYAAVHKECCTDGWYQLSVLFDDGRKVVYIVAEDIEAIGAFGDLKSVEGLWPQVQVDKSRTVVYWNDWIDLPSDTIYEYGQ